MGVDSELGQRACPVLGDGVAGVVDGDERALFLKRVGYGHAEPAGEVVVAAARMAVRVRARSLTKRGDRLRWCDAGDRLDQLADVGAGEREVPMSPARDDADEAGVDEPREMVTRGRWRDARFGGEDARRE